MSEHTPLPWSSVHYGRINGPDGHMVALVYDGGNGSSSVATTTANMDLIVRSVNRSAAFAAMRGAMKNLDDGQCECLLGSTLECRWCKARASLALADAADAKGGG